MWMLADSFAWLLVERRRKWRKTNWPKTEDHSGKGKSPRDEKEGQDETPGDGTEVQTPFNWWLAVGCSIMRTAVGGCCSMMGAAIIVVVCCGLYFIKCLAVWFLNVVLV